MTLTKSTHFSAIIPEDERYLFTLAYHLTPTLDRQLSAFLEQCSGFHYFQSPRFFVVCRSSKKWTPYYVIAWKKKTIVGVLLAFKQVQITLPVASFLSARTIIWGGPVVQANDPIIADGLLRCHQKMGPTTLYTQVRNVSATNVYSAQFSQNGFRHDEHLTILLDLTYSEAALWQGVSTKRRNQIRRAEREGCTVEQQDTLSALQASYAILKEVYQRAKLPLPDFSHFESLHQQADDKSGLRVFTVCYQGKIIGCMLCLAYGNYLFDYYAGAYRQYYKKYPNDLLPWRVFLWAKTNGFTHFDFGGAGKPGIPYGVRDYKKQFGGQLVNYGRYEYTAHPRTVNVVTKAFTLWQRLTQ